VVKSPNVYKKTIPINNFLYKWDDTVRVDYRIKNPLIQKDFWWILGLIIGDGWSSCDGNRVNISFNAKETYYIDKAGKIVNKLFNRSFTKCKDEDTYKEYSLCSKTFNKFIKENIGVGAKNKNIPEWMKYIPMEYK
jgi:hypothetical protein